MHVHVVWATEGRVPMIDSVIEGQVHARMAAIASALGCPILASGGTRDHIHILARMIPAVSVADWVRDLKAGSCLYARSTLRRRQFGWQGGYGVFTLGPRSIPRVRSYVLHQAAHHATGDLRAALEIDGVDVCSP